MKITTFMVATTMVVFAWLAASYFRAVPHTTYEHSDEGFFTDSFQSTSAAEELFVLSSPE